MEVGVYTGIGSRKIPKEIESKMRSFASKMALMHYTLRSGGADGADSAFEAGCDQFGGQKEIYLPWKNFNNNTSLLYDCYSDEHKKIAEDVYGPRWKTLSQGVKKLMTRNTAQVIGIDCVDVDNIVFSEFVVCWTPDGCESAKQRTSKTGGTGQAIELADNFDIPVFNMFNDDFDEKVRQYMNGITLFS